MGTEAKKAAEKSLVEFSHKVESWGIDNDKLARNSAAAKGLTTKADIQGYKLFMLEAMGKASKTGMSREDFYNMQNEYGEGTGRALTATADDLVKAGALGNLAGDRMRPVQIANAMEIFNMGMTDTVDLVDEMVQKTAKMGLDGRKYMKVMSKYVKMAQKYTFKQGVRGVMDMARWAQNVRFNMDSLGSVLDKISEGGLEGTIQQAASLQVLGGHYAMGADPLAMIWERYEDPAALAERYNGMVKGMGHWDEDSGEVRFSMPESMMLEQMAKLSGQSVEDVRAQASFDIKKEKVGNQIQAGSGLDESQIANIINKAFYQNGVWKVNTKFGGTANVSDINSNNVDMIQADTSHEGVVEDRLNALVSYAELESGITTEEMAAFNAGLEQDGTMEENQQRRHDAMRDFFEKHFEENYGIVKQNINEATDRFIETLNADSPDDAVTKITTAIQNAAGKITGALNPFLEKIAAEKVNTEKEAIANALSSKASSAQVSQLDHLATDFKNKTSAELKVDKNWQNRLKSIQGTAWFQALPRSTQAMFSNDPKQALEIVAEMQTSGGKVHELGSIYASKRTEENKKREANVSMSKASAAVNSSHAIASEVGRRGSMGANFAAGCASMKDGIINPQSGGIASFANSVTKVEDGTASIVQSDPSDTALFAKSGGPFDVLFNKVFSKISEVHAAIIGSQDNTK